jgi:hypothetical protein
MRHELRIMITKKAGTLRPFASQLKDGLLELFYFKVNFWSSAFISERIRIFNFKPRAANVILQIDKRDGRNNIKILLATLVLVLFLIPVKQEVFAQEVNQTNQQQIKSILSVSPAIFDIQLKKGTTQTYEIKIKNLLDQPLGIRTSLQNFSAEDEESAININNHSSFMDFSKISDESFIINAGQTRKFNIKINTPKNLKDGAYYEAIFLNPFYIKNEVQNSSPTVLTQVGILIFANNGTINYQNLAKKVSIKELKVNKDQAFLTPSFKVENLYFNHFSAKPFLTITPLLGKSERFELTEKKILPGKIRKWNEKINPKKSLVYKAHLAVSIGQGNFVYKDSYFTLIPFKQVILIGILILFVILIIWRRKQIKKAIKVVISNK